MKNLKKFIGEYAYNIIKNTAVDEEAIRKALLTSQNAKNVFSELNEYEVKTLCSEISNTGEIGKVRETSQEEIKEVFAKVGYDKVIFDDEKAITECKKYYQPGETICTYNDLKRRMKNYHMLVAIKSNIDDISRGCPPQREDAYGTSIINIQIAKNGSHMSIKNRYNHTVSEPDATYNNNLNVLYKGLQNMVLGYYGFATLGTDKKYYNKIVEINGIYLKYHTEENNVYFGEFVLDSQHGIRYNDPSRYFIFKTDNYWDAPLILDFKEKKAINFFQESKVKAILYTRALKENILTSENRKNIEYFTATFDNAKKQLLEAKPDALQYLHHTFGYDFNKPYKVTALIGNYTAKSIEKMTGFRFGTLLIRNTIYDEFYVCRFDNGKFYIDDFDNTIGFGMSTFYKKSDFEQYRKNIHTATFIIQQENKYKTKISLRTSRDNDQPNYFYNSKGERISEEKHALQLRLKAYKTEKIKKEVSQIDYSIEKTKKLVISQIKSAKTSEDFLPIEEFFSYEWRWALQDIEKFKTQVNNKSFTSIEDANSQILSIKGTIEKLQNLIK